MLMLKDQIESFAPEYVDELRLLGFRYTNVAEGTFGNTKGMLGHEIQAIGDVINAYFLKKYIFFVLSFYVLSIETSLERYSRLPSQIYNTTRIV